MRLRLGSRRPPAGIPNPRIPWPSCAVDGSCVVRETSASGMAEDIASSRDRQTVR